MAPASTSTILAHPSIVRNEGRRSLVISIEVTPARNESLDPVIRSGLYHRAGIRNFEGWSFSAD